MMTKLETGEVLFSSPEARGALRRSGDVEGALRRAGGAGALRRRSCARRVRCTSYKVHLRKANGDCFWSASSSRLIRYRGEDVIVSHMRDLTAQMAIEEELTAQRELVFQNEKLSAMGELLAGVAHELNNPLSIVVGHAQMLLEDRADPAYAPPYRADQRRGRALRADREDVPDHGAPAAGEDRGRLDQRDRPGGGGGGALRRGGQPDAGRLRPRAAAAADRRRSRPDHPGRAQPRHQRRAGDPRVRARRPHRDPHPARAGRRRGGARGRGQRAGHPRGGARPHLRAVLHHQGRRRGHRHRARAQPPHHPFAQGRDPARSRLPRRDALPRDPAGDPGRAGSGRGCGAEPGRPAARPAS